MKKSIQTLILAAAMMAGPMALTSCEDLFGEWSRPVPVTPTPTPTPTPEPSPAPTPDPTPDPTPTPKTAGTISYAEPSIQKALEARGQTIANALTLTGDGAVSYESTNTAVASVDATGKVTVVGPGTTTIKAKVADSETYSYAVNEATYTLEVINGYTYMKWDASQKKLVAEIETGYKEITSSTTSFDSEAVNVVTGEDMKMTSDITLIGNTKIILCDGAKLTMGKIDGGSSYSLTIYGQSAQTGQLTVEGGISMSGSSQAFNVHGGKLIVRGKGSGDAHGISHPKEINIFGGKIEVYGDGIGHGIKMSDLSSKITVRNNGWLLVQGASSNTPSQAGKAIVGTVEALENAEVKAVGGNAYPDADQSGGYGIDGSVNIYDYAQVTAVAGSSAGTTAGSPGIGNDVNYYGGTLIAVGGAKGGSSTAADGYGIQGEITNKTSSTITLETNNNGSEKNFTPDISIAPNEHKPSVKRGVKISK